MVLKFPPPPYLAGTDQNTQMLNRWLLEIASILAAAGGIDPTQIPGFSALQVQVAGNTANITALSGSVGGNTANITTLQGQVNALLTVTIPAINAQLTSLGARNQVFSGTVAPVALHADGDWYADTVGKHVYVQVLGAWVLII